MSILMIFLMGVEIFPNSSADFTAYAVTGAGSVIACQAFYITAVSLGANETEAAYTAPIIGLFGGIACHYLFSNHFSTPEEDGWASVGKGHAIIFNIGWTFAIHRLTKDKKHKATLEIAGDKMEKEETIEFYPED